MPAVVQVIVTAEYDELDPAGGELGEAIGEQVLAANARHWDDSALTLLRILQWLKTSRNGHQRSDQRIHPPSDTKDLGSTAVSAG